MIIAAKFSALFYIVQQFEGTALNVQIVVWCLNHLDCALMPLLPVCFFCPCSMLVGMNYRPILEMEFPIQFALLVCQGFFRTSFFRQR